MTNTRIPTISNTYTTSTKRTNKHHKRNISKAHIRGVILEVAEKQCGGADKLLTAISENRVRKETNDQGLTLHFFPKQVIGKRSEGSRINSSSRTKEIGKETHKALDDLVSSLGWSIGGCSNSQQAQTKTYIDT